LTTQVVESQHTVSHEAVLFEKKGVLTRESSFNLNGFSAGPADFVGLTGSNVQNLLAKRRRKTQITIPDRHVDSLSPQEDARASMDRGPAPGAPSFRIPAPRRPFLFGPIYRRRAKTAISRRVTIRSARSSRKAFTRKPGLSK
jgi:hypothetical protein